MDREQRKAAAIIGGMMAGAGALFYIGSKLAKPPPPIPPGPTGLQYISVVRVSAGQDCLYGGIYFEVDIKNTGAEPQPCSPIAYIGTSYQAKNVPMGTQVIAPGKIATFVGNWCWPYGAPDIEDWWRGEYIESEAGIISFEYGRNLYLESFSIPAQIQSGTEFWAEQTLVLPYKADIIYYAYLHLWNQPYKPSGPYTALAGYGSVGGNAFGWSDWDQPLLAGKARYIIRGTHYLHIEGPAIANIYNTNTPLPPGLYDVRHTLQTVQILGSDEVGDGGFQWLHVKVGEVEVV